MEKMALVNPKIIMNLKLYGTNFLLLYIYVQTQSSKSYSNNITKMMKREDSRGF